MIKNLVQEFFGGIVLGYAAAAAVAGSQLGDKYSLFAAGIMIGLLCVLKGM